MLSGKIEIDGNNYNYLYDDFILTVLDYTLISFSEERNPVFEPMSILKAKDNSCGNVFFIVENEWSGGTEGKKIKILGYISSYDDNIEYDRITFESNELDWFYNIRNSYKYNVNTTTGESSINLAAFDTTSKRTSFVYSDQTIGVDLNFKRDIKNMDTKPIEVHTQMSFEFEKTDDIQFALNLCNVIEKFLWFITYRKNFDNPISEMKRKKENGKFETIGKLILKQKNIRL